MSRAGRINDFDYLCIVVSPQRPPKESVKPNGAPKPVRPESCPNDIDQEDVAQIEAALEKAVKLSVAAFRPPKATVPGFGLQEKIAGPMPSGRQAVRADRFDLDSPAAILRSRRRAFPAQL